MNWWQGTAAVIAASGVIGAVLAVLDEVLVAWQIARDNKLRLWSHLVGKDLASRGIRAFILGLFVLPTTLRVLEVSGPLWNLLWNGKYIPPDAPHKDTHPPT